MYHCTTVLNVMYRPTWMCMIILINLLRLWSFELFDNQMLVWQVEALQGYRVIDIACGSGDAQTLCLTDDDTVWSWGDGDYGKLGRGGSDGCKVSMKVLHSYFNKKRKKCAPFFYLVKIFSLIYWVQNNVEWHELNKIFIRETSVFKSVHINNFSDLTNAFQTSLNKVQ